MTTSTTTKPSNFSASQEAIILAAVRENDNIANLKLAEKLAADPRMNLDDGKGDARQAKSITAKLSRMKEAHNFTYERKAPVTKSGQPVQKKLDLVARIAASAGVTVAALDGLEKAPKGTLETIASFAARLADYEADDETVAA